MELDFPYKHSSEALKALKSYFEQRGTVLASFDSNSDPAVVRQNCMLILRDFVTYLPLLGFILRSTDVRNAFEVFGPLLRLARQVLEPDVEEAKRMTRLLLSSEWYYSPFTYHTIPNLLGYVFIGFPAPESENPLVIPLAGHELGHSVWRRDGLEGTYSSLISKEIVDVITKRWADYEALFNPPCSSSELTTNLFAVESWQPALEWGLRQAEESFCDYLGLALFRESFLSAFAYLLSPSFGSSRVVYYPPLKLRAERLAHAAQQAGIVVQADYSDLFDSQQNPPLLSVDLFRVTVADEALVAVQDRLNSDAKKALARSALGIPAPAEEDRVLERFKMVVPAEACGSIMTLLGAAWSAFLDEHLWPEDLVTSDRRVEVLRELVLKNMELMEIERIQGSAT